MQVRVVPQLFQRAVHAHGPRTAVRYPRDGEWHPITYGQLGRLVEEASLGLVEAGVEAGETVAVVARNGPQAAIAELAILHAGATVLALGPEAGASSTGRTDAGCSAAFLDPAIAEAEPGSDEAAPTTIVELSASPGASEEASSSVTAPDGEMTMAQLYRQGQQAVREGRSLDERVQTIDPADAGHLVPGEAGEARLLTHDALLTEARAMASILELEPGQRCLSLASPGDPLQRSAGWHACLASGGEAWLARETSRLEEDLRACRPDVLLAPTAGYGTLREVLEERLAASARSQQRLFAWARSIGERHERARRGGGAGLGLRLHRFVAEGLVLGEARAALGLEQLRVAVAPSRIDPELAVWLRSIGVPLSQAYRPSGAGGVVSLERPSQAGRSGLGRPLPGVEIRIDGEDGGGEILVRGPAVGSRLDGDGERAAGQDGWLRTGERGRLSDGRLHRAGGPGTQNV